MALYDALHARLTQGSGAPLARTWRQLPLQQADDVDVAVSLVGGVGPELVLGSPQVAWYHSGVRVLTRAAPGRQVLADSRLEAVRERMLATAENVRLPADVTVAPYSTWEDDYGRAALPEQVYRIELTDDPAQVGQDSLGRMLSIMSFEIWHRPVS